MSRTVRLMVLKALGIRRGRASTGGEGMGGDAAGTNLPSDWAFRLAVKRESPLGREAMP